MLYRSKKKMAERLTTESIRYAMNQLEKGKKVSVATAELKVTPRHILEPASRIQGDRIRPCSVPSGQARPAAAVSGGGASGAGCLPVGEGRRAPHGDQPAQSGS